MQLTRLWADDWQALYADGELVHQGHDIPLEEAIRVIPGVEYASLETYAYTDAHGRFPETLDEWRDWQRDNGHEADA